jgi:hypothetical protein
VTTVDQLDEEREKNHSTREVIDVITCSTLIGPLGDGEYRCLRNVGMKGITEDMR